MTDKTACTIVGDDAYLSGLFESLDEGVIIWDKDQRLGYANDGARRITGLALTPGSPLLPAESVMSVRVLGIDNSPPDMSSLPVYRAFAGMNVPREEMRYMDPSGKHKWLSVSAKRVLDETGELSSVISSMRDISIRKSRENKLEFMVESAKILSLNLDFNQRLVEKAKLTVPNLADWCIIDVLNTNNTLERVALIHSDEERIAAIVDFEALHPRDSARKDGIMEVIRTQAPVLFKQIDEENLLNAHLTPEHLTGIRALGIHSFMVVPIISNGRTLGAMTLAYAESGRTYTEDDLEFFQEFCYHLAVVFDNARLFQEIETRDKSKDIFLAALSHELRNPLAPIKSSLELLKLHNTPSEIREELDIVEHQFDHMAHLLNDLLDVTRFTQDRISLAAKPIELRRLIERSVRATDGVIRKADITLHLAYPSVPLSVVADETRLEQAVSNLLSNAVKFTPPGGSIWVDIEREEHNVAIRVRDNGAGIEAADLPNIFDMYYQGNNKGAVNSGLGIGLLLVQRIITMHGGTVEAKSDGRGLGSEFVIRLPLAEAAEAPVPKAMNGLERSLRILVVDDNAAAADSLVKLLNKIGAQAEAVYSGHDALLNERLTEVDLFLLDVGMPHMDGYQLVSTLRARGITASIVALTGYGLGEDKARAQDAGFTAHLTKPVGLTELNGLFESVLSPSA